MAIYCHKCKKCGLEYESTQRKEELHYEDTEPCGPVIRNYKAEGARTHIPAYMRAGASDKSEFLPSEKDFTSPEDPTGEKGMKHWKDTHVVKGSTWV